MANPGTFSTLVTTNTGASSLVVGGNDPGTPTTATGGLKAGAINASGIISSTVSVALTGTTNSLGTITTGVWNATTVGVAYGGTALTTLTAASRIPYASSATQLATSAALTFDGTASMTLGPGGTGSTVANLLVDGGSASGGGSYTMYRRNSVNKGGIGTHSALLGGTSDNLATYSAAAIEFAPAGVVGGTISAAGGFSWGDATDPGATNFRVAGTSTLAGAVTIGTTLKAFANGGLSVGDSTDPGSGNLRVLGTSLLNGVVTINATPVSILAAGNVDMGAGQIKTTNTTASTGTAIVHNADGYYYHLSSSARFKDGITDWSVSADDVKRFLATSPKLWDYKGQPTDGAGFIAEDLDALGIVGPHGQSVLTNHDRDGLAESNRDYALIGLQHLILQDLDRRIQALESTRG